MIPALASLAAKWPAVVAGIVVYVGYFIVPRRWFIGTRQGRALLAAAAAAVLVTAIQAFAGSGLVTALTTTRGQTGPVAAGPSLLGSVVTAAVAFIASIITAIVAIVTFALSYRATLRSQRDSQFFEALKRFGDKNSSRLRAGGAVQLAQMASEHREYRDVAVDQLSSGALIEDDKVAIASIVDGFRILAPSVAEDLVPRMYKANLVLQDAVLKSLASLSAMKGAATLDAFLTHSDQARDLTGYDEAVLRRLIDRYDARERQSGAAGSGFERLVVLASPQTTGAKSALRPATELKAAARLRADAERLRRNVESLALALNARPRKPSRLRDALVVRCWKTGWYGLARFVMARLPSRRSHASRVVDVTGAFLSGAMFGEANLRGLVLERVQADGANFDDADLTGAAAAGATFERASFVYANLDRVNVDGACFTGAQLVNAALGAVIRLETADLMQASWWEANFDESWTIAVDRDGGAMSANGRGPSAAGKVSLGRLFNRGMPSTLNPAVAVVHPSVREALTAALQATKASTAT